MVSKKVFNEYLESEVDVSSRIDRIISLWSGVTEVLSLLDLDWKVVAVTPWCKFFVPRYADKRITRVPSISAAKEVINRWIEELKNLNPDIIFTSTGYQKPLIEVLIHHKLPIYPVRLPRSILDIVKNIEIIARVLGKSPEAKKLISELLQALTNLRDRLPPYKTLVILKFPGEYRTAGYFTHISSGLRLIGLKNIYDAELIAYPSLDFKYINETRPEVIIYDYEPYRKVSIHDVVNELTKLGVSSDVLSKASIIIEADILKRTGPSFITYSLSKLIELLH